ncbi:MAG: prolipoprotein diacylglyceryl transferase, partial [Bacteroidales bacterium]|nr:prolipoprotein diacylglyceryl transferase [Bacteroidales bacterium]
MLSFITWNVSPEMFTAGGFALRYYSAFFAIGFILAYFVIKHYYKKENIPQKELDRLTVFVVLGGILGARLGHCGITVTWTDAVRSLLFSIRSSLVTVRTALPAACAAILPFSTET